MLRFANLLEVVFNLELRPDGEHRHGQKPFRGLLLSLGGSVLSGQENLLSVGSSGTRFKKERISSSSSLTGQRRSMAHVVGQVDVHQSS